MIVQHERKKNMQDFNGNCKIFVYSRFLHSVIHTWYTGVDLYISGKSVQRAGYDIFEVWWWAHDFLCCSHS